MRPLSPHPVGLTAFCVLIFAVPALAAHHAAAKVRSVEATPRMMFQDLYSKSDTAIEAKDLDTGLANYDPDFVEVERNGTETDLGDVRYRISSLLDLAKTVKESTTVVSAGIHGVDGTVLVKCDTNMVLINPDTKAKSYYVDKVVSKDTWAHHSDGWDLVRSQILSEAVTNNGHKVYDRNNPFAPPPTQDNTDDGLAPEPPVDNATPTPDGGSAN